MQQGTGPIVNVSEHAFLTLILLTQLSAMSSMPPMSQETTEEQYSTKERGIEGCTRQPLPARNGSVSRLEQNSMYEHRTAASKHSASMSLQAILVVFIVG